MAKNHNAANVAEKVKETEVSQDAKKNNKDGASTSKSVGG